MVQARVGFAVSARIEHAVAGMLAAPAAIEVDLPSAAPIDGERIDRVKQDIERRARESEALARSPR